ncbi:hypothetical protein GCM10010305_32610 [Streptomyces termitum]|uniref:Uncharacterized protein n=1 Tax=Streptomyces termitum TaxID=67368 RepID=A0A918T5U4_9ACTN|nr:hypothetical protein GCM10010305_32610 [Streptomyces termitum]
MRKDRFEEISGMPDIVEGVASAATLFVLRVEGATSWRPQERFIPSQCQVDGTRVEEAGAELFDAVDCNAGAGREPVDPFQWRLVPPTRPPKVLGAKRTWPSTRHRPFGMQS